MLENIFIANHTSDKMLQMTLAYPDEHVMLNDDPLAKQILASQNNILEQNLPAMAFTEDFLHTNCKALRVNGNNLLILPLPFKYLLGFLFDPDCNPYDYRNEVIRLVQEYVLKVFHTIPDTHSFTNVFTNLLLMLFIDIRRYTEESLIFEDMPNRIAYFNDKPMIKVFVYGIDNAGKSSLMRLLTTGKFDHDYFPPTKKFRISHVKLDSGVTLVCWDMPGQKIFRPDWLRGAQASNILLFVLDLADTTRHEEAKSEFWNMVNLYELQGLPILFLANKTDLVSSPPKEEALKLEKNFELHKLQSRPWKILFSSLPEHKGISELITWMEDQSEILLLLNGN
ncbi:MAG: ADP-ribosylation factor-like protein [Promethearchaeota archaeon]